MDYNNHCVYDNYYKTTVGRFYTKEQSSRLLRLFALASGFKENSAEYSAIIRRVEVIGKQNIASYAESKNYSIVTGIFVDDSEMISAVNALVSSHKAIFDIKEKITLDNNGKTAYENKVSWIIALRRSPPENTDMKMELALFEYSDGNVDAAVAELKQLVNQGVLSAMELLACIHEDRSEIEEAFYYYSLIKKVYAEELKMPSSLATSERIESLGNKLSAEKADEITKKVEKAPSFFERSKNPIGFIGAEARRFTYEHQ